MSKQGAAFPLKVVVVIILILMVLLILYLFMSGTFREIFETLSQYLGMAQEGTKETLENIPS